VRSRTGVVSKKTCNIAVDLAILSGTLNFPIWIKTYMNLDHSLKHVGQRVVVWALLLALAGPVFADRISLEPQPLGQWESRPSSQASRVLAHRVSEPPVIDGKLNDVAWRDAEPFGKFTDRSNLPAEASQWVQLRMVHTAEALYVSGRLTNPGPTLRAKITQNQGRVWTDDALELFIHVPSRYRRYQLVINGLGVRATFVSQKGESWNPDTTIKTQRHNDHWTVEAAIPWTSMGIDKPGEQALRVQARYLVNQQAGWVTWTRGMNVPSYGVLTLTEAQRRSRLAEVTSLFFPTVLPTGRQQIGAQVHNPAPDARKVVVRIFDYGKRATESSVIETIQPGQTRKIMLDVDVPTSGQIERTLQFRDMAGTMYTLNEKRRIAAMPQFELAMLRERFWYGDTALEADIDIGAAGATDLKIQLWSETHRLDELHLPELSDRRYALTVSLRGLAPGNYRLVAECQSTSGPLRLIRPIELRRPSALPEQHQIPISVDWGNAPGGLVPNNKRSSMVHCGLSFPGGMLTDPSQVTVVDGKGQPVSMQSDVMARWSKGGSIRWLAIVFPAITEQTYFARFGKAVTRASVEPGIAVAKTESAMVINTGAARFELPLHGPLINRAWRGDHQVLAGGKACLTVVDQNGRVADETHGDETETPVIESSGPLRLIVRREGRYLTADGVELGRYSVRMTFDANSPVVKLQHSLIQTQDSNLIQFRDVAVRVHPISSGPWRVALDNAVAFDNKPHEVQLDPTRGEAAYVAQLDYFHHHRGEKRSQIGERRNGSWQVTAKGQVAGHWAAVRGSNNAGVSLTLRHMPLMFPKELKAGPDGLTAHLWSSRGGRLLDHRIDALIDHWGHDWVNKQYPGGVEAMQSIVTDAAGTARTHDLALHLLAPPPEDDWHVAAEVARQIEQPPLAVQDPNWLAQTEALGRLQPYNAERFPQAEMFIRNFFDQTIVRQAEGWGDFGYLDYGAGPHFYNSSHHVPGQSMPRLNYRYHATDYNFRTALWLLYARSGDRRYFAYADAFNRHLADYKMGHFTVDVRKPEGGFLGSSGSEGNPTYWAGTTGNLDSVGLFAGHQGIDVNNFLYQYFLTGDRHVYERVQDAADNFLKHFDPSLLPDIGATSNNTLPYGVAAIFYEHTWDPRFARLLQRARERLLDPRSTTGLVNQTYYGSMYKWGTRTWGTMQDWRATGSHVAKESLLQGFRYLVRSEPTSDTGYQDHTGLMMNLATELTGDPQYAAWIKTRLGRVVFSNMNEDGHISRYAYRGGHSPNITESFVYGLRVIDEVDPQPWPLLSAGLPAFDVDLVFQKDRQEPLWFELLHDRDWDMQVVARDEERYFRQRGGRTGPLRYEGQANYYKRESPGLGIGAGRVTIPVEAVGGEYQFSGVKAIRASDARKLVLSAPEGVYLDAATTSPPVWYFTIPAETSGGIYANVTTNLTIGGQPARLTAGQWLDFKPTSQTRLGQVHAKGIVFIRFRGDIPPVLTTGDPDRLFVPKAGAKAEPLAELPPVSNGFTTGISDLSSDQAWALQPGRNLAIPRGRQHSPTRFDHFDYERGTIEMWLRPRWTAPMLTQTHDRPLLGGACFFIDYRALVNESLPPREMARRFNLFHTSIHGASGYPPVQRHYLPLAVRQGRWYHFAFSWDTHPTRGWISEMYIDGRPSNPDNRPHTGMSHWGEQEVGKHRPMTIKPMQHDMLMMMGAFDADVDELRISDTPRYPARFKPIDRASFEVDEHTLLLMRFDGSLNVITPRHDQQVRAVFR